jgi:LCP family protein required for cell wall assembly
MNDQSLPPQPYQGNNGMPEQGWGNANERPQNVPPPGTFSGSGLLSKWKATQLPHHAGNGSGNPAVTPPPTMNPAASQPPIQGPNTPPSPYLNGGAAASSIPGYYGGAAMPNSAPQSFAGPLAGGMGGMPPMQQAPGMSPGTMPYGQYGPAGPQAMPSNGMYPQAGPTRGPMTAQNGPGMPHGNWQMQRSNGAPPYMQSPGNAINPQGNGRNKKSKKKRRFPIWARVVVGFLAFLLIVGGAGTYYYYAYFAKPLGDITGQTVTRIKGDDNPNAGRDSGTSGSILSGGRFNILLLGSDDDYKSVVINGGILAQTDIVVSIDPASKTVSMFSIPRDSWVNVPGFGMHKLDQAYLLGGGGSNGAALSMATIHQDFGIYISQYAWVGLSGFVNVINTVGGIDINVLHPITDDAYPDDEGKGATDPYAYKRLYLAPGPQHLDGLTAEEYVRSRHADLVGDFGRSVRQQQILSQLKYKLDNPSVINELPQLAHDLDGQVKTSMQLQDVFNLLYFAKSLSPSQIHEYTLGPPYSSTPTINGQSVVVLNCSLVVPLIQQVFAIGNAATCPEVNSNNSIVTPGKTGAAPSSHAPSRADVPTAPASTSLQAMEATAQSLFNSNSDFFGIHSLLDLVFLVTFESPDALQI